MYRHRDTLQSVRWHAGEAADTFATRVEQALLVG
jgi:hypothetical protein